MVRALQVLAAIVGSSMLCLARPAGQEYGENPTAAFGYSPRKMFGYEFPYAPDYRDIFDYRLVAELAFAGPDHRMERREALEKLDLAIIQSKAITQALKDQRAKFF